ncbi:MAG: PEP-CTERM sorting domain-containing protein [Phycisphaerae bacterium]
MSKRFLVVLPILALIAAPAVADLIDVRVDTTLDGATIDGVIAADEYGVGNTYSYGGGGTGFGGTVGSGLLYMESDDTNLYIGFAPGNNLNDIAWIMFDTREGGFLDADMHDQADGSRRVLSEQTLNVDDAYPILPDFGLVITQWGIGLFELTAGDTDGHLNYVSWDGTFTGTEPTVREVAIPLTDLALTAGDAFDFFMGYTSDSGWNSNESIPAYEPLNTADNPGHDGPAAGYGNYDRFVTVPEPAALAGLLLGLALIRRR